MFPLTRPIILAGSYLPLLDTTYRYRPVPSPCHPRCDWGRLLHNVGRWATDPVCLGESALMSAPACVR